MSGDLIQVKTWIPGGGGDKHSGSFVTTKGPGCHRDELGGAARAGHRLRV